MKSGRTTYQIVMRSLPVEVDETVRLKRLLKAALRRYGFKCLRVEAAEQKETSLAHCGLVTPSASGS